MPLWFIWAVPVLWLVEPEKCSQFNRNRNIALISCNIFYISSISTVFYSYSEKLTLKIKQKLDFSCFRCATNKILLMCKTINYTYDIFSYSTFTFLIFYYYLNFYMIFKFILCVIYIFTYFTLFLMQGKLILYITYIFAYTFYTFLIHLIYYLYFHIQFLHRS